MLSSACAWLETKKSKSKYYLILRIPVKGHAYAKTLDRDLINDIIEFSTKMDGAN